MDRSQKIAAVQSKIFRLTAELEQLMAAPLEPANGAVVRYTRTFGGTKYTYVAVRSRGKWYSSAQRDSVKTWDEIIGDADHGSLMVASMWTLMVPEETEDCRFCGQANGFHARGCIAKG